MKHFNIITVLAALTLSVATPAGALESSNPDTKGCGSGGSLGDFGTGCGGGGHWGNVPVGPGPGSPNLDPSKMPSDGEDFNEQRAERKEKEAERKQKEAEKKKREAEQAAASRPGVKSFGRVNTSLPSTLAAPRTICEAARDARARNSPAAPNLEAQCRARP